MVAGVGDPAHLHVVGESSEGEQLELQNLARELGVEQYLTMHGYVARDRLEEYLLAADVAVQLRTSALHSLSGALVDCIAFGVPTVTTQNLAEELEAPSYIATIAPTTSSLLVAEAIDTLSSGGEAAG